MLVGLSAGERRAQHGRTGSQDEISSDSRVMLKLESALIAGGDLLLCGILSELQTY